MLRSVDVYGDSAVSHRHLDAVRRYGTDDMRFARGCTHDIMSLKYIYPDLYSFYFLPKYLHVQPSRSPGECTRSWDCKQGCPKKKILCSGGLDMT